MNINDLYPLKYKKNIRIIKLYSSGWKPVIKCNLDNLVISYDLMMEINNSSY